MPLLQSSVWPLHGRNINSFSNIEMTTAGTSELLERTFTRGRSAPRPVLGAPDLP